ncbi:hypothetical protein RFI_25244 [Reticulomyxa filosa]|uniref:Uncharacterized protein n=1 Tax=Reticulomyxa filosa TaxID=46433 RepID=X6MDN1_RETFI|nr:hypothetical protein RFI_25244 [Reticulomyxa filosa]|eukprot:ETO12128.1 hypothetical protein RFI_25244 [Reticulomyxa filosa]
MNKIRYNYAVHCLKVPFRDNGVLNAFPGKQLPIDTVNNERYETCGGFLYRMSVWMAYVGWLVYISVLSSKEYSKTTQCLVTVIFILFYLAQTAFIGTCLYTVYRNHTGRNGRLLWLLTAKTVQEFGPFSNDFLELTHAQYGSFAGTNEHLFMGLILCPIRIYSYIRTYMYTYMLCIIIMTFDSWRLQSRASFQKIKYIFMFASFFFFITWFCVVEGPDTHAKKKKPFQQIKHYNRFAHISGEREILLSLARKWLGAFSPFW